VKQFRHGQNYIVINNKFKNMNFESL
jgi:hypothetical protein